MLSDYDTPLEAVKDAFSMKLRLEIMEIISWLMDQLEVTGWDSTEAIKEILQDR
jgi:hypothetical protein